MPLGVGETFAGFTIQRALGAGGMGEVYLAKHPRLDRLEAIKILPAAFTTDGEYRQRFEREADLAASLFHPHIVGIHDSGEYDNRLWLSMDFVDGTDAGHLLRDSPSGRLPLADVLDIVEAVADALDFAHQRRLLHRDVKPANILLTAGGSSNRRILLADFGIARKLDEISGLTATNMMVGTVSYAAPEQLMGEPLDGRADQYALAATAFHLLSGAPLFAHLNPAVIISKHLNTDPPRLSDGNPELAPLDAVLARALAKTADGRFDNCLQFAAELRNGASQGHARTAASLDRSPTLASPAPITNVAVQVGGGTYSHPPGRANSAGPHIKSRYIAMAAIAAVLLVGLLAFTFWPRNNQQTSSLPTSTPSSFTTSTSGAQVEVGNTINYGSFGTTVDIECGDGKSLNVGGSDNTLTVTGTCANVSVGGSDNKIAFDRVAGSLNVVGINNTITYKGGTPKIDGLGSGNSIAQA